MATRLQFLQLDAVGTQPLTVGMLAGELLLDLTIIVYLSFLSVNQQDFTRLQTSLLRYLCRVKIHHTHLTCHYDGVILCDGVTSRTQSVTVQHATCKPSVTEE